VKVGLVVNMKYAAYISRFQYFVAVQTDVSKKHNHGCAYLIFALDKISPLVL